MTTACQFTWDAALAAANGCWRGADPAASRRPGPRAVSTDSRSIERGDLFLALRGPNFDGHDYIDSALDAGAAAVCAEDVLDDARLAELRRRGVSCLTVADTLKAYQGLARTHRQSLPDIPVIAVTGSSGKTSTKEAIAAVLRAHLGDDVLATEKNTNNLIGVPQNLLRLSAHHRAAVLELGTNAPGEIAALAGTVLPTIAVLTNVGPVHLEGLGDLAGVAREKAAVFDGLRARQGVAVVPHALLDNPIIATALEGGAVHSFGPEDGADVRIEYHGRQGESFRFTAHRTDAEPLAIEWPLPGVHLAANAGAAIAVATVLGVATSDIQRGLAGIRVPAMRLQVEERDGVRWINDAYNANPDSMRALIDWLAETDWRQADGALVLVLGDMLEMGGRGPEFHRELLRYVATRLPAATVLAVGPEMSRAASDCGFSGYADLAELEDQLAAKLAPGDTVALKGSRGMRLERLLD